MFGRAGSVRTGRENVLGSDDNDGALSYQRLVGYIKEWSIVITECDYGIDDDGPGRTPLHFHVVAIRIGAGCDTVSLLANQDD